MFKITYKMVYCSKIIFPQWIYYFEKKLLKYFIVYLWSMINNVKGHGARCMNFLTAARNTGKNPIGKTVTVEIHISGYTCQKSISLLFICNTCQQWVENYRVSDLVFHYLFYKTFHASNNWEVLYLLLYRIHHTLISETKT